MRAAHKLQIHFIIIGRFAEMSTKDTSLSRLSSSLREISLTGYPFPSGQYSHNWHTSCHLLYDFKAEIDRIMNSVPEPLQDHHNEHMKSQAEKLGRK